MTKMYAHYGLTGKIGKLDLEEQLELVSDSNDVLMERIVSCSHSGLLKLLIYIFSKIEQCTG